MTPVVGGAIVVLALAAIALHLRRALRRRRDARRYADACARRPWRVAAARHDVRLLFLGDDLLRLWWDGLTTEERARRAAAMKSVGDGQ